MKAIKYYINMKKSSKAYQNTLLHDIKYLKKKDVDILSFVVHLLDYWQLSEQYDIIQLSDYLVKENMYDMVQSLMGTKCKLPPKRKK